MRKLISLGMRCDVAFQLRMHSGDNTSHFFDWLALPARGVIEILRNDFDVFFPDDLRHLPVGNGLLHVEDITTRTQFHHHFPMVAGSVINDFLIDYPQFIGKFNYLASRFRDYIFNHKVTLLRRKISKDEAHELELVFFEKFPKADVEFLYINSAGQEFSTPNGQSYTLKESPYDFGDPIMWSRFLNDQKLVGKPYRLSRVQILGKAHEGYGFGASNRFTEEHMLDAIAFNPEHADFKIELCNIYKRQGDYRRAVQCLEEAKRLGAEESLTEYLKMVVLRDSKIISDSIFLQKVTLLSAVEDSNAQLGYSFYRAKEYEQALSFLNRHLKSHPLDDQAILFKALSLNHLSQFNASERSVDAAIRINAKRPRSHLLKSLLLSKKGDIAGAICAAEEAVHLDSKKAEVQVHLAKLLEKQGHHTKALEAYKVAAELDPNIAVNVGKSVDALTQKLRNDSEKVQLI